MAAGDITKKLCDIVRNDLPDEISRTIRNNDIICNKLHRWEQHIIRKYEVLRPVLDIAVEEGSEVEVNLRPYIYEEGNRDLSRHIYRILGIVNRENILHDFVKIDEANKTLVFTSEAGVSQLAFTAKLHCVTSAELSHTISETEDPEIPEEFHYFLVDYVLAQYDNGTKKIPTARVREPIDDELFVQAQQLWVINKVQATPFPNQMLF